MAKSSFEAYPSAFTVQNLEKIDNTYSYMGQSPCRVLVTASTGWGNEVIQFEDRENKYKIGDRLMTVIMPEEEWLEYCKAVADLP